MTNVVPLGGRGGGDRGVIGSLEAGGSKVQCDLGQAEDPLASRSEVKLARLPVYTWAALACYGLEVEWRVDH